ncbi:DODA-type extradiol aromatic ring-opening family dioxygenase [Pseudidiomarina sp.]|uniref:DODA-type extradiol aromatic ring-opening family dioxygenase n=1 Tax=Pseudidiomarina sp. TaxID=2081707 RepID=UPI003A97E96E
MTQHQVLFVSHGGGPLPLLGDPQHQELVAQLQGISEQLEKPKAILVVSAHWEAETPTVTTAESPGLLYDYYGFPSESYEIQYPAQGHPALAHQVLTTLAQHDIAATADDQRSLDHGVFVPLKLMYPDADIPVIQVSLMHNLDPQQHIALGKALAAINNEGLLILGSGFSFHNMKAFFAPQDPETEKRNLAFENWLKDTLMRTDISEDDREQRLINWAEAPEARFCHPCEEHLMPLLVCYGATHRAADFYSMARTLGRTAGLFYWR